MANNNSQMGTEEKEKLIRSQITEAKAIIKDKHDKEVPPECDDFVARCIRLKDGDMEKAVKLILAFPGTIADLSTWNLKFKVQPSGYDGFYNSFLVSPLKNRDSQGRQVFLLRLHLWETNKVNFDEAVAAVWMLLQYFNKEFIDAQEIGYVTIFDFSNFSLQQAWQIKHWRLVSFARWASNGVVGRIKGVHVVFHSRIIRAIYAAVKPFLKEKLAKRIFFHDHLDGLHKHCERRILPNYLGGDLDLDGDDCVDRQFIKNLLGQDPYFKELTEMPFPSK